MFKLPLQNIIVIVFLLYAGELGIERLNSSDWRAAAWGAVAWMVAVVAARAVARRLLQPWRTARYFGMGMMAVAALITALAQLIELRSFCAMTIRFGSTFLLLLVTAPWFIRKEQFTTLPLP